MGGTRAKLAGALTLAAILLAAGLAYGAVKQEGALKISVLGQVKPYRLPRNGTAPISIFLSGHVSEAGAKLPPQVTKMTIKLNKHGLLESRGIASCTLNRLQPTTTERALSNCGSAVVGSGRFWANVVLPGQEPYATRGRLLIFNGKSGGKDVLFAHIYTERPFPTSFVITFTIKKIDEGPYGTQLTASLPGALGSWGFVDRIKLTLKHIFKSHGETRSYFNAGCPAPKGVNSVNFPLARIRFAFAGGQELSQTLSKTCAVVRE